MRVDLAGALKAGGRNAAGTAYALMAGENLFGAFEREIARPIGMEDFRLEDGAWRYNARS